VSLAKWFVDPDYVETTGLTIVEGRDFSEAMASDSSAILLNEKAVALLGFDDPIGQEVSSYTFLDPETGELVYETYTVIGVVEDFHFKSMKNNVEGLSLVRGGCGSTTLVKTGTEDLAGTLDEVAAVWGTFAPNQPFRYHFLDERFEQMYASEQRAGHLFAIFTGFAILIACLGLFGLASFTAASRTKEIGVRKVLGASVGGIVALLSKDFLKLVALAFLVAVPLAYLLMQRWLSDFAYHVDLSPGVFVLAGALALGIALLTVSYQSIKAALADPVRSLRYE
jgi:putative ABC transport system permease protein